MVVTSRDAQVQEVSESEHQKDNSNDDVVTIYAMNAAAKYIPKKLGFFFKNLRTILFTKSDLKLIEFRDFKNMKKLQKLLLTENQIEKVSSCAFRYTENLEVIDLSGNRITELAEDIFVNLPNLQQFSANDNLIETLEFGLFRNNTNLKKISINHNKISVIEINFMKIKSIELIDLRDNSCIHLSFGCCKGPALREFQNMSSYNCQGSEFQSV